MLVLYLRTHCGWGALSLGMFRATEVANFACGLMLIMNILQLFIAELTVIEYLWELL